ncbi:VOC family protein [Siminovitchia sediminis]|uniref:VOC family protein n=1 Tax=Siminovitchia sediminis TaxID=1274353 RepID=A0ABW4KDU9_9BACI
MNHMHPVIGKVTLTVQNLERMTAFYQDILGLRIHEHLEGRTSFTADGKTVLLELIEDKKAALRNPRTTGLFHIAFLLPERSDLADFLKHLVQIRYPLQGASDHDVSEAIYLADPEGNGLEIYRDREPSEWRWQGDQVYMTTVALDVENLLEDASDSGWNRMPAGTLVGHIHLQVSDLAEAKEFYCDAVGFDPVLKYGSQALFFSWHRYHHHIGLNTWNSLGQGPPAEGSTGLKHYTVLFSGEEERNEAVKRLRARNAWVSEEADVIMTKDPSGIHIVLGMK